MGVQEFRTCFLFELPNSLKKQRVVVFALGPTDRV